MSQSAGTVNTTPVYIMDGWMDGRMGGVSSACAGTFSLLNGFLFLSNTTFTFLKISSLINFERDKKKNTYL